MRKVTIASEIRRIRDAGDGEAFDARFRELISEGMPPVKARAEALAMFPNPDVPGKSEDAEAKGIQDADLVEADAESGEGVNFGRDYRWVYANIASRGATAQNAPSASAWGMLLMARKDPDEFLSQARAYFQKAEQKTQEARDTHARSRRQQFQLLDRVGRDAVIGRDAIRDVVRLWPGEVATELDRVHQRETPG